MRRSARFLLLPVGFSFSFSLLILLLILPVPARSASIYLTWTAPAACTAASPCVYIISRARASGATVCDGQYSLLGGTGLNATGYRDTTVTKGHWCYGVATVQAGPEGGGGLELGGLSLPSNQGIPLTVKAASGKVGKVGTASTAKRTPAR
jgi:hypothetical protein